MPDFEQRRKQLEELLAGWYKLLNKLNEERVLNIGKSIELARINNEIAQVEVSIETAEKDLHREKLREKLQDARGKRYKYLDDLIETTDPSEEKVLKERIEKLKTIEKQLEDEIYQK